MKDMVNFMIIDGSDGHTFHLSIPKSESKNEMHLRLLKIINTKLQNILQKKFKDNELKLIRFGEDEIKYQYLDLDDEAKKLMKIQTVEDIEKNGFDENRHLSPETEFTDDEAIYSIFVGRANFLMPVKRSYTLETEHEEIEQLKNNIKKCLHKRIILDENIQPLVVPNGKIYAIETIHMKELYE